MGMEGIAARPALIVTVALLVAGCGVPPEPEVAAQPSVTSLEASPTATPDFLCDEGLPFEPTYLPDGFRPEVFPFPFEGGRPRDSDDQFIVHYRGTDGRAIEIRRPGTLFSELAQGDEAPTISILGTETSGFAPIQPRGDEFIVQFSYPADADPHDWCALYSLNEYRVPLEELTKVAEGLRLKDDGEPYQLLTHCGLSGPIEFEGQRWHPEDPKFRHDHNPPEGFGDDENYDRGTLRRVDEDTIIYTSSTGVDVVYEPTDRPIEVCE